MSLSLLTLSDDVADDCLSILLAFFFFDGRRGGLEALVWVSTRVSYSVGLAYTVEYFDVSALVSPIDTELGVSESR